MCVTFFEFTKGEGFWVVFNREESPYWVSNNLSYHGDLLYSEDLITGTTWFAYCPKNGRLAFLTNFDSKEEDEWIFDESTPSRGTLVLAWFKTEDWSEYEHLLQESDNLRGFNIVFGDVNGMTHFNNWSKTFTPIENGIHGLSNDYLDSEVKLRRGINMFKDKEPNVSSFFEIMCDESEDEAKECP